MGKLIPDDPHAHSITCNILHTAQASETPLCEYEADEGKQWQDYVLIQKGKSIEKWPWKAFKPFATEVELMEVMNKGNNWNSKDEDQTQKWPQP